MNSYKDIKVNDKNNINANNLERQIKLDIGVIKEKESGNNSNKNTTEVGNKKKRKKESLVMTNFEDFKRINSKSLNKDLQLKHYSKLLLNSMGYYCDLEVNIVEQSFNSQYKKEQISDIDVLACRFDNDLTMNMVPIECKSGERGALEELLKLKGVMDYLNTHKGYLVKNKIAVNAREMGGKIGVSTLDLDEIKELIYNIGLLERGNDTWINTQLENYLMEKYISERSKEISNAINYMKNTYWQEDNYRNFHNILYFANELIQRKGSVTKEVKYIILQLSKYLSLSILRMSEYIIHKNYLNASEKAREYMFGGAKEKREREILFDTINQVMAGDGKQTENFEPQYVNEIIALGINFMKNPTQSKKVPLCIEYSINTFILNNTGYTKEKLILKYNDVALKLAKDIIIFICKKSNIDKLEFDEILNL